MPLACTTPLAMSSRRIGMKKEHVALAGLAVALLTSCSSTVALADPPGFPDLNAFAEVPAADYTQSWGRGAPTVNFSTAEGIDCGFTAPKTLDGQNQLIHCDGPLPGLQDVTAKGSGPCDSGSVNQFDISHTKGACADVKPHRKVLGPGQKVSYGNVTCAVGGGGLIACIERVNPERGFVLQPSGSFVF
ncbi:Uncharacterised protein [Mycobacteroides abscessus subsp. massiliense]|nr:hypothetical protein [Mycobacteroides abscessus]SKF12929.1 Uncharacterised protein [Mycobacteroides abscessus subsp. massiliense]QOF43819.1 hypothetical protein E3G69_002868 [Mycobacteroides abscessus]QOF48517.1 hypothetical protein E3G70_002866 [Mycobacteroides abscessus]CPX56774.1 Uncharacterised protein [Mycobacteroides abscessus]